MARSDIYSLTIHPGLFPPDALVTGFGGSTWLGFSASRGMARIPAQKGTGSSSPPLSFHIGSYWLRQAAEAETRYPRDGAAHISAVRNSRDV